MTRPQRPIFGFLWPRPDPHAPLDGAAIQQRLVRVTPRGPLRVLVLLTLTLLSVFLTASAVLTAVAAPLSGAAFVSSATAASAVAVCLRGWVVGTYVNDHGIVVDTLLRRVRLRWDEVGGLRDATGGVPLLGTPLRIRGRRMVVETATGAHLATHVYTASPDLVGRSGAYDVGRDRLENWYRRA